MSISLYFQPVVQAQVNQIDYTAQLTDVLGRLSGVIAAVNQHDADNNTNSAATIAKLQNTLDVASAIKTLAENGNASLVQIKAAVESVTASTDLVRQAIIGFQSAELDKLESMKTLLQTEFDQTQQDISSVNQTAQMISSKLDISESQLYMSRENIDTAVSGVTLTVPAGAVEVVIYPTGEARSFTLNGKTFSPGEQYQSSIIAIGTKVYTHPIITAVIPQGQGTFVAQYKAIRDLGVITVTTQAQNPPTPSGDSGVSFTFSNGTIVRLGHDTLVYWSKDSLPFAPFGVVLPGTNLTIVGSDVYIQGNGTAMKLNALAATQQWIDIDSSEYDAALALSEFTVTPSNAGNFTVNP